ncbi:MAG: cytochrome c3 family protein, partial [Gammaproteobacteria bacterium]
MAVMSFIKLILNKTVSVNVALALMISGLLIPAWLFAGDVVPPSGEHNGKDVRQPIEFPHNIHVKVNKINCMYC